MNDVIGLRDIFRVLWKRRLLIIGIFVLAVLVAGVISLATPSEYRVSSIIAVGNFENPTYSSQASVKNIMLSDEFLMKVFKQLPNATIGKFSTFKRNVKVEPVKDSDRLIEISFETPDRKSGKIAVEKMILLYANRSEDSYNRYKKILDNQLSVTQERLEVINLQINQTSEALQDMQDSSGSSAAQAEISFSRALDRLNDMENRRTALIDLSLDLQKQLELLKHLEIVSPAEEPASPIWPRKGLIMGIGGMLGLMVGIFVAFLGEELEKPDDQRL